MDSLVCVFVCSFVRSFVCLLFFCLFVFVDYRVKRQVIVCCSVLKLYLVRVESDIMFYKLII